MKLIRSSEYQRKLWKNGRGSTLEIAREGMGEEFDWRLSMADLNESGPFSNFAGMNRVLVLLEGSEIIISHAEVAQAKTLGLREAYSFNGDWHTQAQVTGPGRDFNLIYRPDKFIGSVLVKSYSEAYEGVIEEEGLVALFCLEGALITELGEMGVYDSLLAEQTRVRIQTPGPGSFLIARLVRI